MDKFQRKEEFLHKMTHYLSTLNSNRSIRDHVIKTNLSLTREFLDNTMKEILTETKELQEKINTTIREKIDGDLEGNVWKDAIVDWVTHKEELGNYFKTLQHLDSIYFKELICALDREAPVTIDRCSYYSKV